MPEVAAIILAAGRGSRIGTPKLKLVSDNEFFVNIIVKKLLSSGVKRIICVIHPDDYDWALENVSSVELVLNKETDKGMLFSVVLGIKKLADEEGVILYPVDHPRVEEETMKLILETFGKYPHKIIKPLYENRTGHPVIIPRDAADKINFVNQDKGLSETLRDVCNDIETVKVSDGGILKNINTAEDLS
jgi:molybdenum cofactor cytidylyltransferase